MVADWLARLEVRLADGDEEDLAVVLVALAYAAGAEIEIPDEERRPAARRALLLLATGGDPRRGLDLGGRAVTAFAAELDLGDRRRRLQIGLDGLQRQARGQEHVSTVIRGLANDPDVSWRAYCAAVLTDELEAD